MRLLPLLLVAAAVTARAADAPPAKDDAPDGKKLFASSCSTCHGKDGKGNDKMAKSFKVEPAELDLTRKSTLALKDEQLEAVIASGRKKMPKFGAKYSKEQIAAVVKHVRTLAPAAPKPETKPEAKP